MNDAQIWTIIGIFAATMGTMITLVMMTINAKLGQFEAKLGQFGTKLEILDRDVQTLTRRAFGADRE